MSQRFFLAKSALTLAAQAIALVFGLILPYIRTARGWLYLAVVLDLYSRKVVGWSMAPTMPAGLVVSALAQALQQRRPAPGLVLHSDRDSQGKR